MCRESVFSVSLTIYAVHCDSYCTTYGTIYSRIYSHIFSSTLMLILEYDQYRISTGVLICFYSGHLTSSTKNEVLLCFHVTHSRMHSHIYDQFFI